ncbi:MAG: ThiF family adenylyltransferase, partial [Bryobacteraceae bacterium]
MLNKPGDRYLRQILFRGIGEQGQRRIRSGVAAIVGCGALGTFHAGALARAGVGRLILIDRDYVEWSNLQRQWLYDEEDARSGLPKAAAAARHIARINSEVAAEARIADLEPGNAGELLEGAQVVLDGTDNFETRYLLNDWCVARGVPWIYGGAVGSEGVTMPLLPGRTACFECVYPQPPAGPQPTCETAGVLNAITSLVASWQLAAALKLLAGDGERIEPRITLFDAWAGTLRQIDMPPPDAHCPACAQRSFRHLRGEGRPPISLCGRNAVQIHDRRQP